MKRIVTKCGILLLVPSWQTGKKSNKKKVAKKLHGLFNIPLSLLAITVYLFKFLLLF